MDFNDYVWKIHRYFHHHYNQNNNNIETIAILMIVAITEYPLALGSVLYVALFLFYPVMQTME